MTASPILIVDVHDRTTRLQSLFKKKQSKRLRSLKLSFGMDDLGCIQLSMCFGLRELGFEPPAVAFRSGLLGQTN
jgi:hypothetical protein